MLKLYPYQQVLIDEILSHPADPTSVREAVYAIRHHVRAKRRSDRNRHTLSLDIFRHGERAMGIARQFNLTAHLELWI